MHVLRCLASKAQYISLWFISGAKGQAPFPFHVQALTDQILLPKFGIEIKAAHGHLLRTELFYLLLLEYLSMTMVPNGLISILYASKYNFSSKKLAQNPFLDIYSILLWENNFFHFLPDWTHSAGGLELQGPQRKVV